MRFLVAQADPFEPKATGAKIPDSNTVPSVALPVTEIASNLVSPDATNLISAVALFPGVNSSVVKATSGPTSVTWPPVAAGGLDWQKASDIRTGFELTRPVAHGVRISSPIAPTTATGFIHIAVAYEAYNGVTNQPFVTSVAGLAGYPWYKRVTLASLTQTPLTIVNKYTDETAFRYLGADNKGYQASATELMFNVPYGWGTILIFAEATGPNPIQVEQCVHLEAIPKSSGAVSGSTAAAYSPSTLGAAANMVSTTDFTHTEDNQSEHIASAIGNAVFEGAAVAGNAAVQNIILPGARAVGYNAAGFAMSSLMAAMSRGIGGVSNNPERLSLTR